MKMGVITYINILIIRKKWSKPRILISIGIWLKGKLVYLPFVGKLILGVTDSYNIKYAKNIH